MQKGDYVRTPKFLTVRIAKIFADEESALKHGYKEPTHYYITDPVYDIRGKAVGNNRMIFAAFRRER